MLAAARPDWPAHDAEVDALDTKLGDYHALLNQLVIHTRSYLHLVNVVIAGEAATFLRTSGRIRERHTELLDQAYARSLASQERFERFSLWVSIITVLAGVLAGGLITRRVLGPVRDLAATFNALGRGEEDVRVPWRDGHDEIGEMARAAEVFRLKNVETQKLLADAQRSNQDLEQFAYVASHDLQEPLRMVASYVQLIEHRYVAHLDDQAKQFIAFAVDGTVRMKTLIHDLLAYSRVGRGAGHIAAVDLDEVLADVQANVQASIEERGVRVERAGAVSELAADRAQLAQVLQNLLSNAIKFCDEERPEVVVECVEAPEGYYTVRVRDNGIGIEPEHTERIFEVFQRLHSRDEYEGTGIGLAVCRRLVQRWGGEIWVESREVKGTTVSFTLPAAA